MIETIICTPTTNIKNSSIMLTGLINQSKHDFDFFTLLQGNSLTSDAYYLNLINLLATFDVNTFMKPTNYLGIGIARLDCFAFAKKQGYKYILFLDDDVFLHPFFITQLLECKNFVESKDKDWSYISPLRMNFGYNRQDDGGTTLVDTDWYHPFYHNQYKNNEPIVTATKQEIFDIDTACVLINLAVLDSNIEEIYNSADFPPGVAGEDFILSSYFSKKGTPYTTTSCQYLHLNFFKHRSWNNNYHKLCQQYADKYAIDKKSVEYYFSEFLRYKELIEKYIERNYK